MRGSIATGSCKCTPPRSREQLEALRARAIAECGSFTFDAKIIRADGTLRVMRVTADVERRGGRAVRLYGTKQDVTEEYGAA